MADVKQPGGPVHHRADVVAVARSLSPARNPKGLIRKALIARLPPTVLGFLDFRAAANSERLRPPPAWPAGDGNPSARKTGSGPTVPCAATGARARWLRRTTTSGAATIHGGGCAPARGQHSVNRSVRKGADFSGG
jgi:hypothetical protein